MDRVVNYVGGVTPGYNLGDEALYMVDKDIFAKYPFSFLEYCRRFGNSIARQQLLAAVLSYQ